MKTVRVVRSIVRISLSALLAFALGAGVFTPHARVHAAGKAGHEFIYYNDANHDVEVGYWIYCSNGQEYHSGKTSPYYTEIPSDC
jgi:hypothetical protein